MFCALADAVKRGDAPKANPSTHIAPIPFTRETIFMGAAPGNSPNLDYSMAPQSSLCCFCHNFAKIWPGSGKVAFAGF